MYGGLGKEALMKYDLDRIIERKGTSSVKWEFIKGGKANHLLPLWVADMDFECAEPIKAALHSRVDREIFGYTVPMDDYYDAVTGWFRRRFQWEIDKEDIVIAPGVVPALGFLIRAFTREGDGVIIQRPVYYPFSTMIENNNRKIVNNSLIYKDGKYYIDFEDLEKKAKKPKNKVLLLCSPHNPVGRVWTEGELIKIAEICLKYNVIIVADEVHCDLIREDVEFIPMAKLIDNERIISCTAPSKTFNLAGLKTANIIAKKGIAQNKLRKEIFELTGLFGVNSLSISAIEAAYKEGEDWLNQVNKYIDDNLRFVAEFVKENFPKASLIPAEGTYFAWIDFNAYGISHNELEKLMLEKAEVALNEGYIFGEEGKGFERINVACPRSILEDCLNRMKEAILSI